jgi:hypothetical protein
MPATAVILSAVDVEGAGASGADFVSTSNNARALTQA